MNIEVTIDFITYHNIPGTGEIRRVGHRIAGRGDVEGLSSNARELPTASQDGMYVKSEAWAFGLPHLHGHSDAVFVGNELNRLLTAQSAAGMGMAEADLSAHLFRENWESSRSIKRKSYRWKVIPNLTHKSDKCWKRTKELDSLQKPQPCLIIDALTLS